MQDIFYPVVDLRLKDLVFFDKNPHEFLLQRIKANDRFLIETATEMAVETLFITHKRFFLQGNFEKIKKNPVRNKNIEL